MSSHALHCTMLALAGVLAACKSDRPAAGTESPPATPAGATPAPVPAAPVTVTATDFKLDLPDTLPAGVVGLRLVNHGKELHQAQVVRLDDGKTLADFQQAMKHEGPAPSWAKFVGGPNGVAPGQETTAMTVLAAGNYLMVCFIPSPDGVPHVMKGMIHPFTVAGAAGPAAEFPAADVTVRLVDYGFEPSRPLTSGRHTIRVDNAAQQPHELVLLRMAPGKSVHAFGTWATTGGMKGPPPGMPIGGVAVIEHGESGTFTADLSPGNYGLICFVPDAKDGKLHLQHGMMQDFKVE